MDIAIAYQQTLDYLYEKLPMFSRVGKPALKNDLSNTLKLCEALGNPQNKFKSIHLAGTNGKGSTSHMLSAVLQKSGYKTGLYTSPHLVDFRERIRINGIEVSKEWIVQFVEKCKPLINEVQPSFFEVTVVMAFAFFAEQEVDVAVIETGLGGRLDSTNVITPILSIITNISYDHKDLLGDTLAAIAGEKSGIIKEGIPALIGEQHPETERVFFEHSVHKRATLYYAETLWELVKTKEDNQYQYFKAIHTGHREMHDLVTDLKGIYQSHNIKTVLAAVEILNANGALQINLQTSIDALRNVKKLTGLHGRWEVIQEKPLIIIDVGHNIAGMGEVMRQWKNVNAAKKNIVVGFVKDKDISDVLKLFPKDSNYFFCNAQLPRALPAAELQAQATDAGIKGEAYPTVANAVETALSGMTEDDALLITGSFFVVGEFLEMRNTANSAAKMQ
jgi:dihydrofolate synthase/folylpolyglutamate synthase